MIANLFEIGSFFLGAPSNLGTTKVVNFRKSFKSVPIVIVGATRYGSATNEYVNIQISDVTKSSFTVRHVGGTNGITPIFDYIATTEYSL